MRHEAAQALGVALVERLPLGATVHGDHADAGAASAGDLQGWQGALAGGTTPAGVAVGIAESAEAALQLAPKIEAGFHVA